MNSKSQEVKRNSYEGLILTKKKKKENSEAMLFSFFLFILVIIIVMVIHFIPRENKGVDTNLSIMIRIELVMVLIQIAISILYHLVFYYHLGIKYSSKQKIKCKSMTEEVYMNPIFYLFIIYFANDTLYEEPIDICLWIFLSIQFYFVYYFSLKLIQNFEEKLNKNLNLTINHFDVLLHKFKIGIYFLIAMNTIPILFFSFLLIGQIPLTLLFLVMNNGIFNFFKIYEINSSFDFIFSLRKEAINDIEAPFIYVLRNKFLNKIVINSALAFILLITLIFIRNTSFTPKMFLIIMFGNQILNLLMLIINFIVTMQYFISIGIYFPIVVKEDDDCIICTEKLLCARRLACGHSFHFICLTQWIENGNKFCPLCRRNIKVSRSLGILHNFENYKIIELLLKYLPNEL